MNYYNYPLYNYARPSLFGSLFRNKLNWGSLLDNTQKTLNLVNQAVPIVRQIPPVYRNAKTMFKVMSEFNKIDTPKKTINDTYNNKRVITNNNVKQENVSYKYNDGPTFFL